MRYPLGAAIPCLLLAALAGPASGQSSPPPATLSPKPMPFVRATRNSFTLPATATPQQFIFTQPANTLSYRAFNPCATADIRVMSVAALEPVTSVATPYPGVRLVTSRTEVIDASSGLIFSRGPETVGSAPNPMPGTADRIVSVMIVPLPGYSTAAEIAGLTCAFEIHYGGSS